MRAVVLRSYVVPLASAAIEAFFDRGYLVLPKTFGQGTVERFRRAFTRLERLARTLDETSLCKGSLFVLKRSEPEQVRIDRIVWCGGAEPILGRLGRSPKLVGVAAELLGGPELDQLVNQAHIKNPGDGLEFRYHQDSYHRRYGTELSTDLNGKASFVQTLTAVDQMSPENGGLFVIPGSHRQGHIPTLDGRLPDASFDASRAVPVHLEPGDMLLLSPFTIHGSGPNLGSSPRRLFINGFCSAGANRRVYPGAGTGLRIRAWDDAA
jgi:ectoine hydroxylase-related dioxygenase (phytanoyl-CoA dioxygenase family)